MKYSIAFLVLANAAPVAMACSPLTERATRRVSDVVVWGTFVGSETHGQGTITVKRREKGPRLRELQIRWNPASEPHETACPEWRPLQTRERGRFFLRRNADGTYAIIMHDHRPGIDQ
jgi:hypothetical protein